MSPFISVTFRTARDYEFPVLCLHDVTRALAMAWPDKNRTSYCRAVALVEQAAQGWCTHKTAYDAFLLAATEQGRIVRHRKLCDRVARELAAIEPENFHCLPVRHPAKFRAATVRTPWADNSRF